jgi:hypothetical protein
MVEMEFLRKIKTMLEIKALTEARCGAACCNPSYLEGRHRSMVVQGQLRQKVRANLKEKELGLADHAYNSRYARYRGGRLSVQFLPWTKNVGLYLKNNHTGVVALRDLEGYK